MKFAWLACLLSCCISFAQEHHPQNGVKNSSAEMVAYKNARIITAPGEELSKGTILIKGDEIVEIGRFVAIPKGTVVYDCEGMTILPSFIELNSEIGLKAPERGPWQFRPQMESNKEGAYYWNESIHPEFSAYEHFKVNEKDVAEGQKMGFGIALTHVGDGIAQGTGAMVALTKDQFKAVQKAEVAAFYSFNKGASRQSYPSSQMGSIALLKQAFHDVKWYNEGLSNTTDLSLEAFKTQQSLPRFFETDDKWEILRAQKIAEEFNIIFTYYGSGNEYSILNELASKKLRVVAPLSFPTAYDVNDPFVNRQIPLSELKHWELAPHNPRLISEKGIPMCLTSQGVANSAEFWKNLQRLIETGMSTDKILAALTTEPAKWLGIDKQYGTIEKGKKALFTVYDKNPFEQKSQVLESFVLGERTVHNTLPQVDIRGKYNLMIDGQTFPINITGTEDRPLGKISFYDEAIKDSVNAKTTIEVSENNIVMQFNLEKGGKSGSVNLKGKYTQKLGVFEGSGQMPNGNWIVWSGIKNTKHKDEEKDNTYNVKKENPSIIYPMMAYGWESSPKKEVLLIKNTTVWSNGDKGILNETDVLVKSGKISAVGKGLSAPAGAKIIDGSKMHLTPGIIDEHSHIAISRGVNEGGQAISAEVSIGDVVNPDDINIYRQLSGGVTAAQLLHGSANPIGGQSALIKLKWGGTPDDMLIDNAPKFIKCALGENVKQSNWGDFNTVRFPQTRMGVEQVFHDGFNRALKYEQEKKTGKYRYDLELETLLEILHSERFISCHSYIQSEINMLMHVADSFGFRINTFTHILEGYKVADKMAAHGAGGSTFADWWAYKYEVKDAIPYNASLMQEQGVVVAINSDDAEMGRRLNQEAAKGIKYGGMTEEQALKMVTLNPAKLLHLDDRMGSVQIGKEADLVLWSDHPLSVQAKALFTIVDGEVLFDREADVKMQKRDVVERARIISMMFEDNSKGGKSKKFKAEKKGHFHCNTLGEEASSEENEH
jgi:imidazolonepropionase-like amidohydrolase